VRHGGVARKTRQKDEDQSQLSFESLADFPVVPIKDLRQEEPSAPAAAEEGAGGGERAGRKRPERRVTAEMLATRQREISVAEFFTKNRHLLGFDNPSRALLTTVKEAVDNALDACEEAGILPDIKVIITATNGGERFRVEVIDNGPGIVKAQIPKIFGKLLYGSKFHTLRQARGQQGIGISAAGMYGQLTTGTPMVIVSRIRQSLPASRFLLRIDTQHNRPEILEESLVDVAWDHGTSVALELEALYKKGPHSVDEYVELTAVANPHASFVYTPPEGETAAFERTSRALPPEAREMKPHPYGVELGMLLAVFQAARRGSVSAALQQNFSRVSAKVAAEICEKAGVGAHANPSRLTPQQAEAVYKAIREVKIMAPPSNSVAPIGEELVQAGLRRKFDADYYFSCTRPPAVYRGNPFVIEAGIAFGGSLPADSSAEIVRFANRVPLLYQKGACAITESACDVAWRNYGLQQPRGALPVGPIAVLVHMASAWVPFTSESKEAIAHYPEIMKEMRLALQECGRKLGMHISARRRQAEADRKRSYIEKYIPHIGIALREMLGLQEAQERTVNENLKTLLEKRPV